MHKVSESTRIRAVMLTKCNLHAEQIELSGTTDIPIIAVQIGAMAVVGLYRQFSLVTKTKTVRGEKFEEQQLTSIEHVVKQLCDRYKSIYLLGDMNLDQLRIGDPDYYRRQLLDRWLSFTSEQGLTLHRTGPTWSSYGAFQGQHKKSALDHVYTRTTHAVQVEVLQDGTADHDPVLTRIKCQIPKKPVKECRVDKNWKSLNTNILNKILQRWDWSKLLCSTSVDDAAALLK